MSVYLHGEARPQLSLQFIRMYEGLVGQEKLFGDRLGEHFVGDGQTHVEHGAVVAVVLEKYFSVPDFRYFLRRLHCHAMVTLHDALGAETSTEVDRGSKTEVIAEELMTSSCNGKIIARKELFVLITWRPYAHAHL